MVLADESQEEIDLEINRELDICHDEIVRSRSNHSFSLSPGKPLEAT